MVSTALILLESITDKILNLLSTSRFAALFKMYSGGGGIQRQDTQQTDICADKKRRGKKKRVSKAEGETIWKKKTMPHKSLLFLAALNCYILTIEVWIMYFHGSMTNKTPS